MVRQFRFLAVAGIALSGCSESIRFSFEPPQESYLPKWETIEKSVPEIRETRIHIRGIDILFVIDNSASMRDWQESVVGNMGRFFDRLLEVPGIDARFGVLSTSTNEEPYLGFRSVASTKDAAIAEKLRRAIRNLGTDGSGYESAFIPIKNALDSYPDFVRPNALFALILITDAAEQSVGMNAGAFIEYLNSVKGGSQDVRVLGAFGPTPPCIATDAPWAWSGSAYERLCNAYRASWYPICSPDFGDRFVQLASDLLSSTTAARVLLPDYAKGDSIEIRLDGEPIATELYWFDPKTHSVIFSDFSFAKNGKMILIRFRRT